jgi:hypothetical protein
MVAGDPETRAAIESLGISYDADLSTGITPAAAFVVMSVQMAVTAVTEVLNPNGTTLPTSQVNAIQAELMTRIASQMRGRDAAALTTPATLATALQAAIESAHRHRYPGMTNITVNNPMTVAAAIAGCQHHRECPHRYDGFQRLQHDDGAATPIITPLSPAPAIRR